MLRVSLMLLSFEDLDDPPDVLVPELKLRTSLEEEIAAKMVSFLFQATACQRDKRMQRFQKLGKAL